MTSQLGWPGAGLPAASLFGVALGLSSLWFRCLVLVLVSNGGFVFCRGPVGSVCPPTCFFAQLITMGIFWTQHQAHHSKRGESKLPNRTKRNEVNEAKQKISWRNARNRRSRPRNKGATNKTQRERRSRRRGRHPGRSQNNARNEGRDSPLSGGFQAR